MWVQEGACDRVMGPRIHLALFSAHVEIASVTERLSVNNVEVLLNSIVYRRKQNRSGRFDTDIVDT